MKGVRRILRTADSHHVVIHAEIRGLPPGVKQNRTGLFRSSER